MPTPVPHRFLATWGVRTPAPRHRGRARRAGGRPGAVGLILMALAAAACGQGGGALATPQADLSTGQALMDLGDLLSQLREENALLQAQVDSLRTVVAKQDTLLRLLAAQAGVPVPP
jgi:hypothetical protein